MSPSATQYLSRCIYDHCGIALYEGDNGLLRSRLAPRLDELGLGSLDEYCDHLRSQDSRDSGAEIERLVDSISSTLTFFFRDYEQLRFALEESAHRNTGGGGPLRAWSVACSTGEEAVTMGILLAEQATARGVGDWTILASDRSSTAIEQARNAVYSAESLKRVPTHLQDGYFERCATGGYQVDPSVMEKIRFEERNILDEHDFEERFHVIVCRNLLIYCDWHRQETLAGHLGRYLVPGGFLVLGDLESLEGLSVPFTRVGRRVYRKIE